MLCFGWPRELFPAKSAICFVFLSESLTFRRNRPLILILRMPSVEDYIHCPLDIVQTLFGKINLVVVSSNFMKTVF